MTESLFSSPNPSSAKALFHTIDPLTNDSAIAFEPAMPQDFSFRPYPFHLSYFQPSSLPQTPPDHGYIPGSLSHPCPDFESSTFINLGKKISDSGTNVSFAMNTPVLEPYSQTFGPNQSISEPNTYMEEFSEYGDFASPSVEPLRESRTLQYAREFESHHGDNHNYHDNYHENSGIEYGNECDVPATSEHQNLNFPGYVREYEPDCEQEYDEKQRDPDFEPDFSSQDLPQKQNHIKVLDEVFAQQHFYEQEYKAQNSPGYGDVRAGKFGAGKFGAENHTAGKTPDYGETAEKYGTKPDAGHYANFVQYRPFLAPENHQAHFSRYAPEPHDLHPDLGQVQEKVAAGADKVNFPNQPQNADLGFVNSAELESAKESAILDFAKLEAAALNSSTLFVKKQSPKLDSPNSPSSSSSGFSTSNSKAFQSYKSYPKANSKEKPQLAKEHSIKLKIDSAISKPAPYRNSTLSKPQAAVTPSPLSSSSAPLSASSPKPDLPKDVPKKHTRKHTVARSRKGCWICRIKHLKCDELHPVCSNCTRFRIPCDYSKQRPDYVSDKELRRKKLESITTKRRRPRNYND